MTRVLPTILILALTVWCLVSIVQASDGAVRNLPRWAWIVLVLIFPLVGGVAYVVAGRPLASVEGYGRGSAGRYRGSPGAPRRPAPRGPDDDEDFLKGL